MIQKDDSSYILSRFDDEVLDIDNTVMINVHHKTSDGVDDGDDVLPVQSLQSTFGLFLDV